MKVTIDPNSGFCFGVVYAIQMAEDELDASGQLYCLGDIVHNDLEVHRLRRKGLKVINHEQLSQLRNCKVLIRAHGEPPQTYQTALANNIELLDASCPVVLKLQQRFRAAAETSGDAQLVLLGTPGHAEVNGLMGQVGHQAIIITDENDLDKIDFRRPVLFFSQTTKSTEKFYRLKELMEQRAAAYGSEVIANDTICRQVSNREPQLRQFAQQHEVVLFVSGPKSSNGKVLFGVCQQVNQRSYFISGPDDLQEAWFAGVETVGICGATSTPMWLMEQVRDAVVQRFGSEN
ncbi:MAG: 4-hydroxy-3-methylbut-2-enyl diphosphate reductase [Chitinophagales bacterium]|nr:4-hydroxy-3-methylbut-2-enyl diphosphate reductase [Chitinophagales bacterium]MDW8427422.1 4-hydroxy-3-methylbut-2-enyl diphosphate reductase [Chitinophagales bacterium]